MSEHTVLIDEELAVENIMCIGSAGWEAVVLGSDHICAVDDPFGPDPDCGPLGYLQVPALLVPEDTVGFNDRLRVIVELVKGEDDD